MNDLTPPLPLHLARNADGALVKAKRKRGRPRKLRLPEPLLPSESAYVEANNLVRAEYVATDALVLALENRASAPEVLGHAIEEIAREAAEIRFEIAADNQAGRIDLVPRKISKVIDSYHKIALIVIESAKLGLLQPVMRGRQVQTIFADFVERVSGVAHDTLPASVADEFMRRLRGRLEGWEDRIEQGTDSASS